MRELRGRRVLITGAARGIGLALARRFGEEGAALVLTDVDAGELDRAVADLRESGRRAVGYPLDVTDAAAVDALAARVAEELGAVDVLVNNAGTVSGGPFLDVPLAAHERTYAVNTLGVVRMTHAFLPGMVERGEGHVVVVASASALLGVPFGTTYASSKWAALGFGESLRLELAERGPADVHVTTVCPSLVSSGLFAGSRPPLLTRWLTPEVLADRVVRAVQADRALVLTPWLVKATPLFRGVLGIRGFDAVSRTLGVTRSMSGWTGHPGAGGGGAAAGAAGAGARGPGPRAPGPRSGTG